MNKSDAINWKIFALEKGWSFQKLDNFQTFGVLFALHFSCFCHTFSELIYFTNLSVLSSERTDWLKRFGVEKRVNVKEPIVSNIRAKDGSKHLCIVCLQIVVVECNFCLLELIILFIFQLQQMGTDFV